MQHFGGDWTEQKLKCIKDYLGAYKLVMKNQPFTTFYIDAFAGTGYREIKLDSGQLVFEELVKTDIEQFRRGSADIALGIDLPFDKYIFVEKHPAKVAKLQQLKLKYKQLAERITICQGDANEVIKDICADNWIQQSRRGVIFLDPFGMNITWETLKRIASTKALDLWVLFPLGVAVNRMLTRDGKIRKTWETKLTEIFGTSKWREEFYEPSKARQLSIFQTNGKEKFEKSANLERIALFFNKRLESIFAGVADNPLMLKNSKNNPIYLLCFAVGNERGKKRALPIAQYILRGMR